MQIKLFPQVEQNDNIKTGGESLEDTFSKYGIDIITGPGDCFLSQYSADLGCAPAIVPLDCVDYNGRAIGLMAIARPFQESSLLKLLCAYEAFFHGVFGHRQYLNVPNQC
ncbi:hypothetical protein WAI453_002678 [Rhynchosporium graminicola]